MLVLQVELQGKIVWAVRPDDPLLIPLESMPGFSLLNPAVYPELEDAAAAGRASRATATFVSDGFYYFISWGFFLVSHDDFDPQRLLLDFTMHEIPAFIAHVRAASKQASLSRKLSSVGPVNVTLPRAIVLPYPGAPCLTESWHLRTAVRAEHIERAGRHPLSARPPSHDTLLLDAIDALHQEDFATAFLLAAISMDHLVNMQAELAFAACLQQQEGTNLSIIIPASTPRAEREQREELLSDLLMNNRRFQDVLKKVLPALTGKSLPIEDKTLYDNACRVYQVRNSVVHKKLAFRDDTPRTAGVDEAILAINTAVRLVEWFGIPANYAHAHDRVPPPTDLLSVSVHGGTASTNGSSQ